MQWLTERVYFHEAENSRQKERYGKMSDVQMFWSLCEECVEFLSKRRSGAVLIKSRHSKGQTGKRGRLYQKKSIDRVLTTYIRYVLESGFYVSSIRYHEGSSQVPCGLNGLHLATLWVQSVPHMGTH